MFAKSPRRSENLEFGPVQTCVNLADLEKRSKMSIWLRGSVSIQPRRSLSKFVKLTLLRYADLSVHLSKSQSEFVTALNDNTCAHNTIDRCMIDATENSRHDCMKSTYLEETTFRESIRTVKKKQNALP